MQQNAQQATKCQYKGVRDKLPKWEEICQDSMLLQAIKQGARAPIHAVPKPNMHLPPCPVDPQLTKTIGEYCAEGAMRELSRNDIRNTRYWVPIFGATKKDSHKVRLITDLRALNECHDIQKHHPQTWKQILQTLQNPTLQWGITLDLRGYFNHLAVHPKTKRWMRVWYGGKGYQLEAMPFGWSMSPFWAHRMSLPIRRKMKQWGIPHCWWVDDILILGPDPDKTAQRAQQTIRLLTELGIQINIPKSMKEPAQIFQYVGHIFNLKENTITPIPAKREAAQRMVQHQITSNVYTPRHMAALAGTLLDQTKSNIALLGMPQILMRMAAQGVRYNRSQMWYPNVQKAWSRSCPKPHQMKEFLHQALHALAQPTPRVLRPSNSAHYLLQMDASKMAWEPP